jgi:mRNA interferase MazF
MEKDFDRWNKIQKKLHFKLRLDFQRGDIWLCHIGINVGSEQDGKGWEFLRPIVIIKKFDDRTFFGIPLTSKHRSGNYYFDLGYINGKVGVAMLNQLRLWDALRLKRKIGYINKRDFTNLVNNLKALIP